MRIQTNYALLAITSGFLALSKFTARADGNLLEDPEPSVANKLAPQIQPFDLRHVRLRDGPFSQARDLDLKYLLSFEPQRLLRNFRVNAGLPTSAEPLGGWESPHCELRGHFVGHYLSACALMYASTGDEKLKTNANAVVTGLGECQAKLGSGYLSAFPETFFDRLEARHSVWAPYYTIHKILAGLLDVYLYCDNAQALAEARKLADWVIARNERLSDAQMQAILGTEQGGMNEALANLYGLTGEEKYLSIARRFNHLAVLGPASKQVDRLTGLHANTQIPKFIGAARQYELTGDETLKTAAVFFWDTVVRERSYVTGGTSDGEYFTPKDRLSQALSQNTAESCDTYNMLKLTRHLFCLDPQAEYADYFERALYNHILAAQNPETGVICHFLSLKTGSQKRSGSPTGLTCCTGTGIESYAKLGESIYFHDTNSLFVNLFIPSELDWKAKGLKVRQDTKYPEEGRTRLTFACEQPVELSLRVRHPWWAASGMEIRVNRETQAIPSQPTGYAVVKRLWKSGDTVEVSMPFSLRAEGFRDNPGRVAFLYGPLVLCGEVGPLPPFPTAMVELGKLLAGFKPVAGKTNTFTTQPGTIRVPGAPAASVLTFEPFYQVRGDRNYEVYWDVSVPASVQVGKTPSQTGSIAGPAQANPGTPEERPVLKIQNQ